MKTNHKPGFTLVEIMVVVALIGLLATITIPAMSYARVKSQTSSCINNLRQIDCAKDQYGFANYSVTPAIIDLIPTYLSVEPVCPAAGSYIISSLDAGTKCTIMNHTL
ncbi:MAG: type II secretion system protein [bacterium]